MASYQMLVFSDPEPGREDEYNDWYNNVHLSEILEHIPGFVSAQRFALEPGFSKDHHPKQQYLAVYDVETDDPEKCLSKIAELVEAGTLTNSDTLGRATLGRGFYRAVSEKLTTSG